MQRSQLRIFRPVALWPLSPKHLAGKDTDLIDTGLIRFEMHPFPLDGLALRAHALCRALPTDSYFKMVVLLDKQESWIGAADPVAELKKFAKFPEYQAFDEIMQNRLIWRRLCRSGGCGQPARLAHTQFCCNGIKPAGPVF